MVDSGYLLRWAIRRCLFFYISFIFLCRRIYTNLVCCSFQLACVRILFIQTFELYSWGAQTHKHPIRCYRYGNVLSLISFHVDDNKMQIIMLSRFIYLQFQSHFQVLVLLFFCGLDARLLCLQAFLRSI